MTERIKELNFKITGPVFEERPKIGEGSRWRMIIERELYLDGEQNPLISNMVAHDPDLINVLIKTRRQSFVSLFDSLHAALGKPLEKRTEGEAKILFAAKYPRIKSQFKNSRQP